MGIFPVNIKDAKILIPQLFTDTRGDFMEFYNENTLNKEGIKDVFVQDNISSSIKGVLRGVHTQLKFPQAKIVSCLKGIIWDVIVDCREDSPTYGSWYGDYLTEDNHKQLYIPQGVAHGYYALSDATILMKVTTHYTPGDEIGFKWNDEKIGIEWPLTDTSEPILAEKDKNWGSFDEMMKVLAKSR
jgi:dTDP-4-dehydrorhamnose 3,5-epimerase